jgi:myosin heavy subunit
MLNQDQLQRGLSPAFDPQQAALLAEVVTEVYTDLVKTSDFNELKEIVRDLAQAQNRTEQRMEELAQAQSRTEQRMEELAQAQNRTEQRVEELAQAQSRTEQRVEELAQAQSRTEQRMDSLTLRMEELAQAQSRTEQRMDSLTLRMEELAQAQSRTEQRMDSLTLRMEELAQAQSRTEQRMDSLTLRMEELAQAQNRTEVAIQELTEGLIDVRKQLGGLATTVGYRLEDEAYKALPTLLQRDHHIEVQGRLKRGYVTDAQGRVLEVNILGDGWQSEQPIKIIGESKSQLSIPNIDRFIRRHVTPLQQVFPKVFPVLITYMVSSPEVDAYAEEQGIALYYSYDF